MTKLILASASPRRRALFSELGWNFEAVNSNYEEQPVENETAEEMTARFALGKAMDVFSGNKDALVIGADTAVIIGSEILGKPKSEAEACEMLEKLQGKTHSVVSSVAIVARGKEPLVETERTDVTFRKLSADEIKSYVATAESMDKAGAYAIQGHGMLLVEKIDGCYFNVVGLPVQRLSKMLETFGITLNKQWGN